MNFTHASDAEFLYDRQTGEMVTAQKPLVAGRRAGDLCGAHRVAAFRDGTSFLVFRTSGAEAESTPQALALWTVAALIMTVAAAYRQGSVQTPNVPACPGN
jgi:hypothetical protein